MEIKCDKSEAQKVIVQVDGETIFEGEKKSKTYHCPACGGDKIFSVNDKNGVRASGCFNCFYAWTSMEEVNEYINKRDSQERKLAVFALCLSSGALILSLITFVVKLLLK